MGGWVAGEVENIAISTQVEVVVDLKLELSLAICRDTTTIGIHI